MGGLRVLITNAFLRDRTGSEMYTYDLARALLARGHTPLVYTPAPGELAAELADHGVEVSPSLSTFARPPDIVHGQHTAVTVGALLHFRGVPGIYVCHDATHPIDTPPLFPRILRHVAVDHNCRERVERSGVPAPRIRVIYNAVDLSRFKPRSPLPVQPARALLFSNYARADTHLGVVREACARAHLPLDVIGLGVDNPVKRPEEVIGRYDLVFAKARCALESMAVGAAVLLCDFRGVGGMVTSGALDELRRWNFGARLLQRPLEPQILLDEMARYDRFDAGDVARRVRAQAGLEGLVDQLIALYREVLAEWARAPRSSRAREKRAADAAVRAACPHVRVRFRDRVRGMPVVGAGLVALKRTVLGPRTPR